MRLPISACIIAKNEEKHIRKAISSVINLVEEVLILDTGSDDKTIETAKESGATVFSTEWQGDFAKARNEIIEFARSKYILMLDADEYLCETSISALQSFCLLADDKLVGRVTQVNELGNNQGRSNVKLIRIFPNQPDYRYSGKVHEQLTYNGETPRSTDTAIELIHVGYDINTIAKKDKINRNLSLLHEELIERPDDSYILYQIGKTLSVSKRYEEAIAYYEQSIEKLNAKGGRENNFIPSLLKCYAECLFHIQNWQLCFEVIHTAVDMFPDYTDLYYLYAQALTKSTVINDLQDIEDIYKYCLHLGEANPNRYETVQGVGSFLAHYNLGVYFEISNKSEEALMHFREAALLGYDAALKKVHLLDTDDNCTDQGKSSISICMIVKNEEKHIRMCIEKATKIANEIIIVDTGSTDDTVNIVKHLGIEPYLYEWKNDFSSARNYAISLATSEYIFQLDADEMIEFNPVDLDGVLTKDYYLVKIKNYMSDGTYNYHSSIRLFKNKIGLKYKGRLHEQINIRDFEGSTEGYIDSLVLHHLGYLEQEIKNKNKLSRNMTILLEEVKENPTAFNYFNLGNQYKVQGDYWDAINAYKKSFSIGSYYTFTSRLLLNLIQTLIELKEYDQAIKVANDGILMYPQYTDLHYYRGIVYKKIGYLRDAEESFNDCLKLSDVKDPYLSTYEGTGTYLALIKLAEIYYEEQQYDKALSFLTQALKYNVKYRPALEMWLNLSRISNDADESQQFIRMFKPESQKDIKNTIHLLYSSRHRILLYYLESYVKNPDADMIAIINLYNGNYNAARVYWQSKENVNRERFREVFLVTVILQDEELFDKWKEEAELNKSEQEILKSIIRRSKLESREYSTTLIKVLRNLFLDILMHKLYDLLDYFNQNAKSGLIRYYLADTLVQFGFSQVALDLLVDEGKSHERARIYELTGDILQLNNSWSDALYYYYQVKKMEKPSFHLNYKIYLLNKRLGHECEATKSLCELASAVPQSTWAKNMMQYQ